MTARRVLAIVFPLFFGALAPRVWAGPALLEIAHVDGGAWSLAGLRLGLDWRGDAAGALELDVERLELGGRSVLERLRFGCAEVRIDRRGVLCPSGAYAFTHRGAAVSGSATLDYAHAGRRVTLTVDVGSDQPLVVALALPALGPAAVKVRGAGLPAAVANVLLGGADGAPAVTIGGGTIDVEIDVSAGADTRVEGRLGLSAVEFSDAVGRLAAEGLELALELDASTVDAGWEGQLAVSASAGGVYAEPVFLDVSAFPLDFAARFALDTAPLVLGLEDMRLTQRDVLDAGGRARIGAGGSIEALSVTVHEARFPAVYEAWLAGALVGTPLAELDTAGSLAGVVDMAAGALERLAFELGELHVEDRRGRFALYELGGEVHWSDRGADLSASRIEFAGGHLFGAAFDAAVIELGMAGQAIDLLEPARLPLLGGALAVSSFSLRDYGSDDISLGFEAALEPIDLGQLTLALGWPPFAGTLAGKVPLLVYENGVVTVGGDLEATAFDGEIRIEDLRVENPFGLVPEISASVRLRNLDLEQVTAVVPFGRVSGRLHGDIDDLALLKGEPVTFDARFYTPEDDDSRHRLSQRAVDTISRVAGGGAALSSTFLRIFENFAYDRLGISCRLVNDVCLMDGVEQADGGYYIVKGALLPRVDLIGRVRQVRWSRLIEQLERALNEGEFRIE
ncbi:MAG: hypothetical protein ACU85V_01115 [Gammaproteobacteria bacterium]